MQTAVSYTHLYTVMNLFRDYDEKNNNDKIFNYYAAGFNRDGMALRTALHMMKDSKYSHKILIILSDGRPNDMLGVTSKGIFPLQKEYSDETGVGDTCLLYTSELNICDVLKDSLRSASNLARQKNINIQYNSDKDVFLTKGDYGRLRQMFLTVIDNAIKFSHDNKSIYITLKAVSYTHLDVYKRQGIILEIPAIKLKDTAYLI